MRIALIDPQGINSGLNIGLGILSACFLKDGYEVRVIDLNNNPENVKNRIKGILGFEIIGISVKSFTYKSARGIVRSLGRNDIICGGPHITLDGINFLKENSEFKFGIIGEAEESLPGLLKAINTHLPLEQVRGIVYRSDSAGEICLSERRDFIADIDSLPLPDYSCFDSVGKKIFDYPVLTSRGCPYACIYCCVGKVSGMKMRYRSIENVILEIEQAKVRYGFAQFCILDDNFTFDVERAKDFCRLILKDKMNLTWSCPNGIRADRLDEELVSLMKSSGCRYVSIGIESLDEEVYSNIKKQETLEDIKKAIVFLNKYKIKVNGFLLIGLPKDTPLKTRESIKKSRQIGLDTAHWNMFVPYPGTEVWKWLNKEARIIRDWKEGFHFGPNPKPTFETRIFKEKEMITMYKAANIKCRNYSAFFNQDAPLWVNCINLIKIILRYDSSRVFGHIKYILSNLSQAKRYLR